MAEAGKITAERLERALAAAAQLALQDETVLPIFERLQKRIHNTRPQERPVIASAPNC